MTAPLAGAFWTLGCIGGWFLHIAVESWRATRKSPRNPPTYHIDITDLAVALDKRAKDRKRRT